MRSQVVLALLIAASGIVLWAGHVRATPGSGLTTTTLARSLFEPIDLKGRAPEPCKASGASPADLARCAGWAAGITTGGLSDVYVVDNKLAPGAQTGWHSHPGPSLILVVAGTVTDYLGGDPTCTGRTYAAGQGFTDPGGTGIHMLRNEGSTPAETIAVQFLPKSAPRRLDVPDPGHCHF